jgi:hypothetical protein
MKEERCKKSLQRVSSTECHLPSFDGDLNTLPTRVFVHDLPKATKEKSKWEEMNNHLVLDICGEESMPFE